MRSIPLYLFVALAACTEAPPVANQAEGPDNSVAAPSPLPTPIAEEADSNARPRPGELGTFRDWTVGCDNGLACKAVALAPEDGDVPSVLMSIARDPADSGGMIVRFTGSDLPALPLTVAVDGKTVASGGEREDERTIRLTEASARTIALEAVNGTRLTVAGANGPAYPISLAGLSAALRYMDAEQGVAGTAQAIVARGGSKGALGKRDLPVIRAINPAGAPPPLDAALVDRLRKDAKCAITEFMDEPPAAEAHALGDGATLILLPCDAGAYNLMSLVYVAPAGGEPVLARFDVDVGMAGPDGPQTLVNAGFADGVLSSFAKGRGIGDCGVGQNFVWDGKQFRLSEQVEMGECRGSVDFIPTWRARVVRAAAPAG
ncbi:DUF1176 domain-containing protein [Sphingomonas sp. FW199]|uniref:DUF1176 domain-containing protein n=1 Tax=Sphingomonas sp. FW199 TaxID=3400217 RepID=UPI003CFB5E5A